MQKRKKNNRKKVIITFFLITFVWIFGFYLYTTYQNIEIKESNYTAKRLESTEEEQTVEKVQEKSKEIADIIEETTKKVVGISKLKNTGSSILTGEKYSKCSITLENGNTYDGTVVWSDEDLDLSITKINAKNLEYINLGNSDEIRVGETVYAIRKSHRI